MPSLQTIAPSTRESPLEKTLQGFSSQLRQNQIQKQDTDALSSIYEQFKNDGENIREIQRAIQTSPNLSPTARVNAMKENLEMEKNNVLLQKQVQKQQIEKDKAEALAAKEAKQLETNKTINADLERRRGLPEGDLKAYDTDPKMAEAVTRPAAKTQASQPIEPEQLRRIQHVRGMPGFAEAPPTKQYQMLTDNGVSKENAESEIKPGIEESKISVKKQIANDAAVDSAYKAQEKFINDTTSSYKAFETDTKPKLLQMQKLESDGDLISAPAATFLEKVGLPIGILDSADSELYNKLSLDLLKGLPETYGNRILKVEVDNFLKTVPNLLNSANGRRMIASNILKLGEMKEVYYNEMRDQQRQSLDSNKPLPRDFQQKVFDQVRPQIDRINREFVRLADIKDVPEGTIPFFDPNGDVTFVPKEHAEWAEKNQGRRIW